jgi:hypothetical protein
MREPKEILHEYVFHLDGMTESIKARIMVDLMPSDHHGPYSWDISHFFKDCDAARHAETLDEAKEQLKAYTQTLTVDKIFAKNLCY